MINPADYLREIEARLKNVEEDGEVILSGTCLGECSCPGSGAHDRFKQNNTRTKMETIIIDHIKTNFTNQSVRLLSLGSGHFLQDYLLVLKLLNAGIYSIDLTMIEPSKRPDEHESGPYRSGPYVDLIKELDTLKSKFPKLNLQYRSYRSVNETQNNIYDVIYAIDYEDYLSFYDHSNRQLDATRMEARHAEYDEEERLNLLRLRSENESNNQITRDEMDTPTQTGKNVTPTGVSRGSDIPPRSSSITVVDQPSNFNKFKRRNAALRETESVSDEGEQTSSNADRMLCWDEEKYTAAIDLIKADSHANRDGKNTSLTILSRGQDIVSLSSDLKIGNDYPYLANLLPNSSEISAFYINANISHLINNIAYFSAANKPLIINTNIIKTRDRPLITTFLKNHCIEHYFMDEKNTKGLEEYQKTGLIAVVDYTAFDTNKNETAIPIELDKKNIFVVRCDWVHSQNKKHAQKMQFFPLLDKARRLVLQEPAADKLEIVKGIDARISNSIDKGLGLKLQKNAYLSSLKAELNTLDEETKRAFAYYLLSSPEHLLKKERDWWRSNSYSLQTKSFQDAMSISLGNNIEVIHKVILINDYVLSRHADKYKPMQLDDAAGSPCP